jgi:uncharacterized protein with PQ loop repeat
MKPLSDNAAVLYAVAILGIVATQIMNLSSVFSIIEILKARSTLMYPTFPFSISIVASATSIIYAVLSEQLIVGLSSMMTVSQCSIYLSVHWYFSKNRRAIVRELTLMALAVGFSIAIGPLVKCPISVDCSDFTTEWFGLVMAIVSCLRYGAQAASFREVVSTKNSASISPYMTAGALFGSAAWTLYALLAGDPYYLASGLAGLLSCIGQVVLLIKYPRSFEKVSNSNSKIFSSSAPKRVIGRDSEMSSTVDAPLQ